MHDGLQDHRHSIFSRSRTASSFEHSHEIDDDGRPEPEKLEGRWHTHRGALYNDLPGPQMLKVGEYAPGRFETRDTFEVGALL